MNDLVCRSFVFAGAAFTLSCGTLQPNNSEGLNLMSVTADDVASLVADLERGAKSWVNGQLEEASSTSFTQANDMVLVGPFGGEPLKG